MNQPAGDVGQRRIGAGVAHDGDDVLGTRLDRVRRDPDPTPRVQFDYTGEGWQRLRTPALAEGGLTLDD